MSGNVEISASEIAGSFASYTYRDPVSGRKLAALPASGESGRKRSMLGAEWHVYSSGDGFALPNGDSLSPFMRAALLGSPHVVSGEPGGPMNHHRVT
ncbi:MAG: hypothetical protein EKK65_04425, partial [Lysobacterales bacterium]